MFYRFEVIFKLKLLEWMRLRLYKFYEKPNTYIFFTVLRSYQCSSIDDVSLFLFYESVRFLGAIYVGIDCVFSSPRIIGALRKNY